jgi:hypothetical protein
MRSRTYDRFVFWRLEALLIGMPSQDFARYRVIVPEIPILDILLRQLGLLWHLVSECERSATNQRIAGWGRGKEQIRTGMGHSVPRLQSPFA